MIMFILPLKIILLEGSWGGDMRAFVGGVVVVVSVVVGVVVEILKSAVAIVFGPVFVE